MRWLARVFTAAIVRRLAYILVALALAALGVSRAHAGTYPTQGEAFVGCMAEMQRQIAASTTGGRRPPSVPCELINATSATPAYVCKYDYSNNPATGAWATVNCADRLHTFPRDNSCKALGGYTGSGPWSSDRSARSGSIGCRNGCDGAWFGNADGSKTFVPTGDACPPDEKERCKQFPDHFWNPILNVCEPPEGKCPNGGQPNSLGQCAPEPCPPGMAQQADGTCKNKDNECPAGQVKSPAGNCLPGDGQCAAGEVRGKDGTCKRDSDGDGEPDPGEEGGEDGDGNTVDEFSGGDDCRTPPTCSGSPIMCGQARIQWRIDCNTRKNRNIAGGMCTQAPICTGEKCDALEYSSLLMQWRTACAVEKLNSGSGAGTNPDVAAIRNALTGNAGTPDLGDEGNPSGAFSDESGYGAGGYPGEFDPDTSGFGYSRTCPTIPAVAFMGQTINFDTSAFCNWMVLGGQFVLIIASLLSLRIISSGGTQ